MFATVKVMPGRNHSCAPGFLCGARLLESAMSTRLRASEFARTLNLELSELFRLAKDQDAPILCSDTFEQFALQDTFSYADALLCEVSMQLSDDGGMSFADASILIANAGLAGFFSLPTGVLSRSNDFWTGIACNRNTWGAAPRGSWKVTHFGPSEYWSSAHFAGTLEAVTREIREYIEREEIEHPDTDPTRIFLTNVSAADRRLRRRAAKFGIAVVGNEFA
jgi:hypothetical protein